MYGGGGNSACVLGVVSLSETDGLVIVVIIIEEEEEEQDNTS